MTSEHPLAKGGANSAPLQELWRPDGTEIFQNQNSFSADLDRLQPVQLQKADRKENG